MKQKLLILGAVFFGILAAFLTWSQINAEQKRLREQFIDCFFIVATTDIPPDVEIQRDMLRVQKVQCMPNDGRIRRDFQEAQMPSLVGKKLRVSVREGQTIAWSDVSTGGVGTKFSERIPAGNLRAVTVSVDAVASVAGLIRPQDNVDIIGTFRFPDLKGDQSLETITLTVLQNVKVLATGTDYGLTIAGAGRSYNTMTLALTPTEAELIIFASQKGRLSFTLRSPQETKANTDLKNINWPYLQEHIKNFATERETMNRNTYR